MKKTVISAMALLGAVLAVGSERGASAAIVYRQDFDQNPANVVPTTANSELSTGTGWNLQGSTVVGGVPADVHPAGVTTGGISADATAPSNGGNTDGANGTVAASAQGSTPARVFYFGTSTRFNAVLYTTTAIDAAAFTVTGASWQTKHNAGGGTRLALKVGGQWYAGTTFYQDAADQSVWTLRSVDVTTELFQPFNFVPGVSLDAAIATTPGTAVTLPAGGIEAFGLYLRAANNGNVRVDGFSLSGTAVTAVPEPGAMGVGLGAAALMLGRRRR